jgi:hypothetical protein
MMGIVLKADDNLYCEWSSIVDGPKFLVTLT